MAIDGVSLTANDSTTNATSYTTASHTLNANRLCLLSVAAQDEDAATPPEPTITGHGATWVLVLSNNFLSNRKSFLFRTMIGSNDTGTITIDFGTGETQTSLHWHVSEWDGVDTGGDDGANAIVQSAANTDSGSSTPQTVTMASFADSTNNVAYGTCSINDNETITVEAGYAELAQTAGTNHQTVTEWNTGEDLAITTTTAVGERWVIMGVEIAIAPAAGAVLQLENIERHYPRGVLRGSGRGVI